MSNSVIKVENVGKLYHLGQVGTGTIANDVNRWWHRVRGLEDPYLKIGESNDRTKKGISEVVWALKDISFEVNQGEVLGIIGKNGAGKSTLLKILSRVTNPSVGQIKVKGRIASLLEVGTGFHPELTGRENIFLNGAILGMTKQEIRSKFDEIVDFSGVERYIDTPVKRYSSGMYVRLAFAVAAHLEPEILIIDEVLAVGDAEFQKKCLGKMKDVSGQGRTVLFVSHNMGMVNSLCNKGIVLTHGQISFEGSAAESVSFYLNNFSGVKNHTVYFEADYNLPCQVMCVSLTNNKNELKNEFDVFEEITLSVEYEIREDINGVSLAFVLEKDGDIIFISFDTDYDSEKLNKRVPGKYRSKVKLPSPLKAGMYNFANIGFGSVNTTSININQNALSFEIKELSFDPTFKSYASNRVGIVPTCLNWQEIKLNS